MSELIGILQEIIQDSQKAQKPADVAMGRVVSVSPLSIQIESTMQAIPAVALILTSSVTAKTAAVQGGEGGTVVINEGLAEGDRVIMLRASKGQRYIVLSKVQEV